MGYQRHTKGGFLLFLHLLNITLTFRRRWNIVQYKMMKVGRSSRARVLFRATLVELAWVALNLPNPLTLDDQDDSGFESLQCK